MAARRSKWSNRVTWHWDTHQTAAPGSNLWPVTWEPDDHLYVAWGDGGGLGGTNSDGRASMGFARIEDGPEKYQGVNINGGKNPLPGHRSSSRARLDGKRDRSNTVRHEIC
ncbi:MAG: hypothetical protein HYV60_12115 [Planctomycetia bacterium]|nr:hypothetical protein [Planctomycetia bacterium]